MKNIKLVWAIAGTLAISTPALVQADEKKPEGKPNRDEAREKFQNLSPEEREAKKKEFVDKNRDEIKKIAKDLDLDPEELKKLSPEERRIKVKEAADKKLAELNKKKSDGSLTDEEKQMLQRMEQRKRMMEQYQNRSKPAAETKSDK